MRKSTLAISVTAALSTHAFLGNDTAIAADKTERQRASGPVPNSSAQFPIQPRGSVLYDQSGAAVDGAAIQFSDSTFDSEGADDFVVTDAAGWSVSGLNLQVSFDDLAPGGVTYDVDIYADAAGSPDATAACTYSAVAGTLDATETALSISLPSACDLAQGTYWLSVVPNMTWPPQFFWSLDANATIGAPGQWRNPADGYGSGCTAWSPLTACGFTETNYLFQIIGAVGGGGGCGTGGICLEVTLGTDTTTGACGTTDTLDVTVGDQVNYCYTVTNESGATLEFHTLVDNINGTIFSLMPQTLADGASYQHNRIMTAGATEVVTSTWTAQDEAPGYSAELTTGTGPIMDRVFCDGFDGTACDPGGSGDFIDISGSGTSLGLTDDSEANVTMPFSVTLYGVTSNQLRVGNNGAILFGVTTGEVGFSNTALPMAGVGAVIAPLWDDFDSESGDVLSGTVGTAPDRKFVVQWEDRVHFNGTSNTDGATFQVVFDEATGGISFQYLDVQYTAIDNFGDADPPSCNDGVCATIGLQADATLFNEFSFMTASIGDNTGITWTPTTPQLFTDDDTTTLNVGAPDIEVDPTAVAGTVPEGGAANLALDIDNVGDRDLVWSTEEAPAPTAHFPPPGTRFVMPVGDPARSNAGPVPLALRTPADKFPGPVSAPLGSGVPAFAADVFNDTLITFDALAPGVATTVSSSSYKLTGGTFIDGDLATMIAIDGFSTSPNNNKLVEVDVATGAITDIATVTNTAGEGWTSLDYDSTTGNLYASTTTCGAPSNLWTIDPVAGTSTLVGSVADAQCLIAIAVSPDGLMYGLDIVSDSLLAIDKTSGASSVIGSLGFNANYAQDMTFDQSTGVLYIAGFDATAGAAQMYTADLVTGLATPIGLIGDQSAGLVEVDAIAIMTAGGPCSQPTDLPWLSISPASGTTAPGGTTPLALAIDGSAALEGETLSGTICITSNDPDEHRVEVPVEVTVGPGGGGGGTDTFSNNTPVVFVDDGYDGTVASMVCSAIDASAIPGANTVSNVTITSAITHTWAGDLTAKLISPDGGSLTVFNRPGFAETVDDGTGGFGESANLAAAFPLTFDDTATADAETMGGPLTSAQVICQTDGICSYFPNPGVSTSLANFAGFTGESASGTWTLCVGDSGQGDLGQMDGWSITITHQ